MRADPHSPVRQDKAVPIVMLYLTLLFTYSTVTQSVVVCLALYNYLIQLASFQVFSFPSFSCINSLHWSVD